jgi:hypothetical protein
MAKCDLGDEEEKNEEGYSRSISRIEVRREHMVVQLRLGINKRVAPPQRHHRLPRAIHQISTTTRQDPCSSPTANEKC